MSFVLIGFVIHFMIFNGLLTVEYIKRYRKQFNYSLNLEMIEKLFKEWKTDDEIRKRTREFTKALWKYRTGYRKVSNKNCNYVRGG